MSNIYSTKFMNEASATLADKVFKRPVNETYLFSTMNILREMNSVINDKTKDLYIHIAEAESKEEENKLFGNYFYEFKEIFQEFANKVNEMKSRMIITIENKVETYDYLFKDDAYIASFNKQFSYKGYQFSHIEKSDYPRLNLYKLYQKEFDYLGHLMQDNGIDASPSAKLKVIASVCNNFANCSGDKAWVKSLICDMVEVDDKEVSRSYSECIYNALRDKYDFNVDKGMLYSCKESLCDYEDVIDAAVKMCDNLLCELDKVAENISSYLFRNNDKKLKIKTDTDGIIDRDYRLDTYSMNQLDLFLKNKINQIKKVLNVYSIALGIKFDTAVDYISQNIDILRMAKEYNCDNTPDDSDVNSDEDNADNDMIDDVENGEEYEDQPVEDDDSEGGEDDDISDDVDDEGKEPIEEEPETDELGELDDDLEEDVIDYEGEEFEESYLFESELFELEMLQEMESIHKAVREALLLEEETPETKSDENQSLQKVADKQNTWQKIVSKLLDLWRKFKEVVFERTKAKIDYLKKNEKYIKSKVEGKVKLLYGAGGVNLNNLSNLKKIPDLNYQALEKDLVDDTTFIKAHFNEYFEEGKSISDVIKEKFLGKPYEELVDVEKITPSILDAYDFCVNYPSKVDPIKAQLDLIEKAQRVAKNVSNVQESVNNNDYMQYFSEMEGEVSKEDKQKNEAGGGDKAKKLSIYFKVCSQVLAAEMTVYQKWFNELYKFCKWYIKSAGGEGEPEKKEEGTSESATLLSGVDVDDIFGSIELI